jgi:hypothetical protein
MCFLRLKTMLCTGFREVQLPQRLFGGFGKMGD